MKAKGRSIGISELFL